MKNFQINIAHSCIADQRRRAITNQNLTVLEYIVLVQNSMAERSPFDVNG